MGILEWIGNTIIGAISGGISIITNGIRKIFGIKPKPPSAQIRAELRQQWLELAPGGKEISGVKWEGEIFYETPK